MILLSRPGKVVERALPNGRSNGGDPSIFSFSLVVFLLSDLCGEPAVAIRLNVITRIFLFIRAVSRTRIHSFGRVEPWRPPLNMEGFTAR